MREGGGAQPTWGRGRPGRLSCPLQLSSWPEPRQTRGRHPGTGRSGSEDTQLSCFIMLLFNIEYFGGCITGLSTHDTLLHIFHFKHFLQTSFLCH